MITKTNSRFKELKVRLKEAYRAWVPPGHFYSPIPDMAMIKMKEHKIWGRIPGEIKGVDLNLDEQLKMIDEFVVYYPELPFANNKQPNLRYYFQNKYYSCGDAIILYSMLRFLKPKIIIEIGSGFSSGVILDTNEIFFDSVMSCIFIEPYPERLFSLMKNGDGNRVEVIGRRLQDIDINIFNKLQKNDILLIDSSHVSKIDSDVNYIFFEILPNLNKGVFIHFHDIFYPFEYPKEWVYEGRVWNESYMLRTFLQYNDSFRVVFFNNYLAHFYKDKLAQKIPLFLTNPGGSIWIRKG